MNIIIYSLIFFVIIYYILKLITKIPAKKISKQLRILIFFVSVALAIIFAIGGKFLLSLPLTLLSLGIVKLKGLSLYNKRLIAKLILKSYQAESKIESYSF